MQSVQRNILSLGTVSTYHEVTYLSDPHSEDQQQREGAYQVKLNDGYSIYFNKTPDLFYTFSTTLNWFHDGQPADNSSLLQEHTIHEVNIAVNVHDSDIPVQFTKEELVRANIAGRLHRSLHHPCDSYLSVILDNGTMLHTYVTSKDLRNYRRIHGRCKGCQMGKAKQPSSQHVSTTTAAIGELLLMDIF